MKFGEKSRKGCPVILVKWIFLLAILAVDVRATASLLRDGFNAESLGLHFSACFAGFIFVRAVLPQEERRGLVALFLLPLMIFFPVFGLTFAGGLAVTAGSGKPGSNLRGNFVGLSDLLPGDKDPENAHSYGSSVSTIPEIMWGTDVEARRKAAHAIRNLRPIDSLPILRRLTQDDDEIVRLFALGERRRIVSEFEERSRKLARKRAEQKATVSELLLLAESYLEEVEIGLPVDRKQREALLESALDVLREARRRDPDRPDIKVEMLRCALASGNAEVAEHSFHHLRDVVGVEEKLALARCEYFFLTGKWNEMLRELQELPESMRRIPPIERVLEFWDSARVAGQGECRS